MCHHCINMSHHCHTSARTLVGRYVAWDWLRTNWYSVTSYWDTTVSSAVSRWVDN